MCPLEFVATPTASPRTILSGIFKRFGVESKGISGTEICANRGLANCAIIAATINFEPRRIKASWKIRLANGAKTRCKVAVRRPADSLHVPALLLRVDG